MEKAAKKLFFKLLSGTLITWLIIFRLLDLAIRKIFHAQHVVSDTSLPRGVSVILLNFNGRKILEETLPALELAARETRDKLPFEIIFIDNGSTDGSQDFVRQNYPDVKVVRLEINHSFAEGNNIGIRLAKYKYTLIISNDMLVEKGSFGLLTAAIEHSQAFAVSPQQFFWDSSVRREETGLTRLFLRHGLINIFHADLQGRQNKLKPIFWAGAGFSIYDTKMLRELSGFSRLYEPIYWEDVDLSYRAWRRGWPSYVLPSVHVRHKHQGTTKTMYQQKYMRILRKRNALVFFLSNLFDWDMLWPFFIAEIKRSSSLWITTGNFEEVLALFQTISKSLSVLMSRNSENRFVRESDQITFWRANDGDA